MMTFPVNINARAPIHAERFLPKIWSSKSHSKKRSQLLTKDFTAKLKKSATRIEKVSRFFWIDAKIYLRNLDMQKYMKYRISNDFYFWRVPMSKDRRFSNFKFFFKKISN